MIRLRLAVVFCLWLAGPATAQQRDFDSVTIKTQHVAGKVYMLEGMGGNIGVSAGSDGILIVDDQFAPLAEKIRAALKGIDSGDLKFLLNTHFHGDHTGGNPIFGKEATIIAQTHVRDRLSTQRRNGDQVTPPMDKVGWPVITYDDAISIHFNGEEIKLKHYPHGHTDGDTVIWFTESNVIHMGDDFFNGRFPFVDLNSGGSVQGLVRNVGDVLSRLPPDIKIIPGHGPLGMKEDLRAFYSMLIETVDHVRNQMAEGKSLDAIKAAGFPDKWKGWGEGFISGERWAETIYNSYSK